MIRYNTYTKEYQTEQLIEGDVYFDTPEECISEICEMINHVVNMAASKYCKKDKGIGDLAEIIKKEVLAMAMNSELDTSHFFRWDE